MFLLIRSLAPGSVAEALLGGLLFAWSPTLIARGATHLSLVAAAPLPLFVLALLRLERHGRARDGILLGLVGALAAFCDAYYVIYCGLFVLVYLAVRMLVVGRRPLEPRRWGVRILDGLLALALVLVATTVATGGMAFTVFGQPVSLRSLYTPSMALVILAVARMLATYHIGLVPAWRDALPRTMRLGAWAALAAGLALAPRLYGLAQMASEGRFVPPPLLWRSSPPGVDALALLVPNPQHPLAPAAFLDWISTLPNGDIENVASIPIVALAVLAAARWHGWRAPVLWTTAGVTFLLLALGPFVRIGGFNTAVPGPWALLRYVPGIELARTPTRMVVMVTVALAVLFALALRALRERYPTRRGVLAWGVGAALVFELLPAPRTLSTASVPRIYDRIAADPRTTVTVLELPFGLRDGTSSFGNFTARTLFFQTAHGKAIFGGYLSRLSPRRVDATRAVPLLDAFMQLSEGKPAALTAGELTATVPDFMAQTQLGYVVIDRARASDALMGLAKDVLQLEWLGEDAGLELYRPAPATRASTGLANGVR